MNRNLDKRNVWSCKTLHSHFRFAKALTARYARTFYLAAQFLPREKRWATYAVYGFCRYTDNIVDEPRARTPDQIHTELRALKTELEFAYRNGESEHPVLKPFIAVARLYDIPAEYPLELLEGVAMDLEIKRYDSFEGLNLFCYRVASVVGLMMSPVLGYRNPAALIHAEKLGTAMQLTNILRDVKEDKNMDRIYLPADELERFSVSYDDIVHERWSDNMRAMMQFQVERAHRYYEEAEPGIAMLDADSRYTIYSASRIYRGILETLAQRDYNPFLGRVFVPYSVKCSILAREVLRSKIAATQERLARSNPLQRSDAGNIR